MFHRTPDTATAPPAHDVAPADLIPLSQLSLDVDEPSGGWEAFLTGRDIEVVTDDVGRKSVSRSDARMLLDEQREAEARQREAAARNEQRAIEADRLWRSQLSPGTPWYEFPHGVSPAGAWAAAEKDAQPRRVSVLQEALAGEGTTYHPIRSTLEE